MTGRYWLFKAESGNINMSFSPCDPYRRGWLENVSTISDARRIMGI